MKNYYKILEIDFGVDVIQIKKAYRRLALKYHPDKNSSNNAAEIFIQITEAYEVLNDSVKRAEYDKLYSAIFMKKEQSYQDISQYNLSKVGQWESFGKEKANEYARMAFDEFADRIIDELKIGISYTPNLIFLLFFGVTIIGSFDVITKVNVPFGMFLLIASTVIFYFIYDRAKKDYLTERRIKILNKYK